MVGKNLKYSRLIEDDEVNGWEKQTVKWVITNQKKVKSMIASYAREHAQQQNIDDIYQRTVEYFFKSKDYDINVAIERGHDDTVTSLESYISHCIKCCVIRFVSSEKYKYTMEIHDKVANDDENFSILENMPAKGTEIYLENSLEEICRDNTSKRYMYGADMYQVMYIKLMALSNNLTEDETEVIFKSLGVEKEVLDCFDTYSEDAAVVRMVHCIVRMDLNEAARIIRQYVYGANNIDKAFA